MKMYYSAKTGGFYVEGIHDDIPEGSVVVSAKVHREIMDAQSAGKRIVADDRGRPVAAEQPEASVEVLGIRMRRQRDRLLAASDYRAMPDYPHTDIERAAWLVYRQALREVPEQAYFPGTIAWPAAPST